MIPNDFTTQHGASSVCMVALARRTPYCELLHLALISDCVCVSGIMMTSFNFRKIGNSRKSIKIFILCL
jgi:hypothetical protein